MAFSIVVFLAGCANGQNDPGEAVSGPQQGLFRELTSLIGGEGDAVVEERSGVAPAVSEQRGDSVSQAGEAISETPPLVYSREYYAYRVRQSRDPFQPLLVEGGELRGLTLNALVLTGVMWGEEGSLAVMEDHQGRGYILKVGDEIAGARLVAIRKDAAVFRVVEFGVVHNVEKRLLAKEDKPI